MKHRYNWLIQALTLAAWSSAIAGYFGPWVGHPAAALAWNAYDLFDLLQQLPHIEHGILVVNLQTLHWPMIGLGILAPLMLPYPPNHQTSSPQKPVPTPTTRFWRRSILVCLGTMLSFITLPPYPEITNAWRTPGWERLAFWWGAIGIISTILVGYLLGPHLGRYRPWVSLACITLTSIPASVTLQRSLPALAELHAIPVTPGWGFYLYAVSALALALCFGIQGGFM